MLNGVQVLNALGTRIVSFYMEELLTSNKYVIKSITGQGPVKATVSTSSFGSSDGERFQNARVPKRNLVINIGYNPDYASDETVEDLRLALYGLVPPKANIRLRFVNDKMETVETEGWVESLEPVIWTETPEIQLSIICPLPALYSLTSVTLNGTQDQPIDLSYIGTAGTGFVATITSRGPIASLRFSNGVDPDIRWAGSLLTNDVLSISTTRGARYIRKNGVSVLDQLTDGSLFMEINQLVKKLRIYTSDSTNADFAVTYKTRYVGV